MSQLQRRRSLTIVGADGVCKTSVTPAVAWQILDQYVDGGFFVDLAPLSDTRLVSSTVAMALELPIFSGDPTPGLTEFLYEKYVLIVLNNRERAVTDAAILGVALRQR